MGKDTEVGCEKEEKRTGKENNTRKKGTWNK